jgi:osmotically-inducible protein OsmY
MNKLMLAISGLVLATAASAVEVTLEGRISEQLRHDPLLSRYYIQVDVMEGLAVLHGWVRTPQARRAIEERVRNNEGVVQVYSYIVVDPIGNDTLREIVKAQRVQIAISNQNDLVRDDGTLFETRAEPYASAIRVADYGVVDAPLAVPPLTLASAVKTRLDIDPIVTLYNVKVDAWNRTIILNGVVRDERIAADAERIAARTPGVTKVVSYLIPENTIEPMCELNYVVTLSHPDERTRFANEPVYVRYRSKIAPYDPREAR